MRKEYYLLLFLIMFNLFLGGIIYDYYFSLPEVDFLSVGQGDAELIQTPAGNILIDAGPGNKILEQLSSSLPFYDRTIDLVIISHPNKDHYYGLKYLLQRYRVRAVMMNNWNYSSPTFQKIVRLLQKEKVILLQGYRGIRIRSSSTVPFHLTLLYPPQADFSPSDINQASIIANLIIKNNQFLFTGDTTAKEEKLILSDLQLKPVRVLKVAHHGSKTSSSLEFLSRYKPQFSVIEVGKNNYDLPNIETLRRLYKVSSRVWRTDIDGIVKFFISPDGKMRIIQLPICVRK